MAERCGGMDHLQSAPSSPRQGCSSASPCPPSTLKPSTAISLLQAPSQPCRQPGNTRSLGTSTGHHPGWGPPVCQALESLSSLSWVALTCRVALYYLVGKGWVTATHRSLSMLNPISRNPDATGSRSSSMRSYTLTEAVRLLSHLCGLALEPDCLFVYVFPLDEVGDKAEWFPWARALQSGYYCSAMISGLLRCLLQERPCLCG